MEYLRIEFDLSEPPSTGTIERLFDGALDAGCFTSWGGGADQCRYSASTTDHESRQADTESAIDEIADAKDGRMTLFCGEYDDELSPMDFTMSVSLDTGDLSNVDGTPQVLLSVDSVYLDSLDAPATSVEARSDDLLTLAKEFYSILQPVHVVGRRVWDASPGIETRMGPLQADGVTVHEPLDWMAIFTPETVERIGTDWLDAVDLHRHERLDDGSLLVVLTPRPDMTSELAEKHDQLEDLLDFSE